MRRDEGIKLEGMRVRRFEGNKWEGMRERWMKRRKGMRREEWQWYGESKMTSLYYHQTNDLPNIHACPVPHHNYIKVIKYSLDRQQDVVLLVLTVMPTHLVQTCVQISYAGDSLSRSKLEESMQDRRVENPRENWTDYICGFFVKKDFRAFSAKQVADFSLYSPALSYNSTPVQIVQLLIELKYNITVADGAI